jgi:hypothetical protein
MGWLFAFALIIGMVFLLSREQKRLRSRTEKEYQRDVEAAGKSLLRAGLFELQKTLQPEARSAIEFVLDEQKGMAEEKQKSGDSTDAEGGGEHHGT